MSPESINPMKKLNMPNLYSDYIGAIVSESIQPKKDLVPFIKKYLFFQNNNVTNKVQLKLISNAQLEMHICYDTSRFLINEGKKEIKYDAFISGIFDLQKPLYYKPMANSGSFKCVTIAFTFSGVYQLLGLDLNSLTNTMVDVQTIFGRHANELLNKMEETSSIDQKVELLNGFFMDRLNEQKKKLLLNIYCSYMIQLLEIKDVARLMA